MDRGQIAEATRPPVVALKGYHIMAQRPYNALARQLLEEVIGIGADEYRLDRVNTFLETEFAKREKAPTVASDSTTDKLTFKQAKFLFDHLPPDEIDGIEVEILAELNLKTTVVLYKSSDMPELTPETPISASLHYYEAEETDDFIPAEYSATLYSDNNAINLRYDDIEQLFQLDPDQPVWELNLDNTSCDKETIAATLARMDK